ncbi:MAG: SCO family protein [Rhodospirillales bacterium]|nr:SCO family protein [Rhodospirillales bacterium]
MSRTAKALIGIWILLVIGAAGWFGYQANQSSEAAIGGPLSLTDQDGRAFTDADLKGKPTLLYFGYTFCPDVCPTSLLGRRATAAVRIGIPVVHVLGTAPGQERLLPPLPCRQGRQ